MQDIRPHTQTYTQMARAAGARFVRAYTSTTAAYYRIKLYGCSIMGPVGAAQLQPLFPEARVVELASPYSYPVRSVVLYFDRQPK